MITLCLLIHTIYADIFSNLGKKKINPHFQHTSDNLRAAVIPWYKCLSDQCARYIISFIITLCLLINTPYAGIFSNLNNKNINPHFQHTGENIQETVISESYGREISSKSDPTQTHRCS